MLNTIIGVITSIAYVIAVISCLYLYFKDDKKDYLLVVASIVLLLFLVLGNVIRVGYPHLLLTPVYMLLLYGFITVGGPFAVALLASTW